MGITKKMRTLRFVLAALAVGAWAAGPLAGAAGAGLLAPAYQSSSPESGAMMDEAPSEVKVTFSEPLDPSSVMNVIDECGNEVDSGPATVTLNEMTVGIAKTPAGMYEVVYRAVGVGDVTGTTASSFGFMVHNGTPCKGSHGGHDGHGGHDPGKGHGNGHHGHDGHSDGHGGDHDMSGHDMTDHGSTSGHDHMAGGSVDHTDHASMDHGSTDHASMDHGGHGEHANHAPTPAPEAGDFANPAFATGPGATPIEADAGALLLGLGLALAVGVLGGWLLRISGNVAGRPG